MSDNDPTIKKGLNRGMPNFFDNKENSDVINDESIDRVLFLWSLQ